MGELILVFIFQNWFTELDSPVFTRDILIENIVTAYTLKPFGNSIRTRGVYLCHYFKSFTMVYVSCAIYLCLTYHRVATFSWHLCVTSFSGALFGLYLQDLDPLLPLMIKPKLTEEEVHECKKVKVVLVTRQSWPEICVILSTMCKEYIWVLILCLIASFNLTRFVSIWLNYQACFFYNCWSFFDPMHVV